MSQLTTARRFVIERDDARILDGVVWPDGHVALRWRIAPQSNVQWATLDECVSVNVDQAGGARLVWIDDDPTPVPTIPSAGELAGPEMPAGAAPSPDAQ